jgi:glycosyltransferase involved in cell wall biosynthesis
LEQIVSRRYGASASSFLRGIDHETYKSLPTHRRDDLVLAGNLDPLALLALEELHRRRPKVQLALFGETPAEAGFPFLDLGMPDGPGLAHAYASAAVGLVVSLTSPSPVPYEMLACGLPVVDIGSESMVACFGQEGPITLAEPNPFAICDRIESLLDDLSLRADASRAGIELTSGLTWEKAALDVEAGLRSAFY